MSAPVEDISYLLRSERRVRVLELLAAEPHTVGELASATDASRKTVRRAVRTFEEYGWVRRDGRRYATTKPGDLVADRTGALLDAGATARLLRPVAASLPDGFDVGVERLGDARVTVPAGADTVAPARRMVERLRSADRIRVVAFSVAPGAVEATRNGSRADLVLSTGAVEFILDDPETRAHLRAMLEADWPVRQFDGELEYNLVVADGTVMLGLVDETGAPSGLVETDDDAVREWAVDRFEHYRDRAEPVDPARLDR